MIFFFFLCVPLRVWKEIWRNVTRVPVEEKVNVLISREGDNNKCVLLVYCDNPTLKTGGLCIRHMKGKMDVC